MKRITVLFAAVILISAALTPSAFAAFTQTPQQPPAAPPNPSYVPVYTVPAEIPPRGNSPLDGMWVTTLPNGQQFFLLFTGNQYQIWDNSQMMDSGTIQLQGDAMTQQSASGKTDVHTVQFNPNGNSFSIVATNGQAGATTYQRVQQGQGVPPQQPPVQTPPVQYPQQPPTEQPPVQFPTQPPVQQPPVQLPPQPGNPPQQQQISMDGRWNGVDREGLPVLMIISGNTFQIWYVNANRLFLSGTFQIQGNYANFNGEILNGFQVSPDGNSFSYNANGGFVMTYHRER